MRRAHTRTRGACSLGWFRRGRNSSQAIFGMPDPHTLAKIYICLWSVRYGALLVSVPPAVQCALSLTKGALHCKGLKNVTVPLATIPPCPSKLSHLRATNRKQKMTAFYSFSRGLFFLGAALLIMQNVVAKPRSYWGGWPEGYRELVFPGSALLMQNVVAKSRSYWDSLRGVLK